MTVGFSGWAFALGGVVLTDGCGDSQEIWDASGCGSALVLDVLTATADGLDLPDLRNEDVEYPQRDGVRMFSDWYTGRTIVLTGTLGPADPCSCPAEDDTGFGDGEFGGGLFGGGVDTNGCECLTVREQLTQLVQAWKRQGNTELVIYPPCEPTGKDADRMYTGPFGVVGRPRAFKYKWNYNHTALDFVATFYGVDQRMYILDDCGTPGYTNCVTIEPGAQILTVCADEDGLICAGGGGLFCANGIDTSDESVDPTAVAVGGTEKVNPTITLYPPLIRPYVQNITTGEYVQLDTTLDETATPVTINTEDGTAFDAQGNSLTHLLRGYPFLSMYPGNYEWRTLSAGVADSFDDPGSASLCWRPTVVNA